MLIDTRDIISMTELRERLTKVIMATKRGRAFAVSERGNIVSLIVPANGISGAEKADLTKHPAFGILKAVKISDKDFLSGLSSNWW